MDLREKTASLYGMDLEEMQQIVAALGQPKYRAAQILEWLYQRHIRNFEEAKNLPHELIRALQSAYLGLSLELVEMARSSKGESVKYLFRAPDGGLLESVLIEQQGRKTVCVSTQLGCKIGCIFCASGKAKFGRNLTAGEIVEQIAWIERNLAEGDKPVKVAPVRRRVTNVVFMGMGEPLDNFEATMKALRILQASWGFEMGARRITVSTSGITPKIVEFVKRNEGRVRLSVSLHSSDEKKRSELVPINKKYPLEELVRTLNQVHRELKRNITFEYTLIAGLNDSPEEAEGVARIAGPLEAKVNLIPYNPIEEMDLKRPVPSAIERFREILERHGVPVTVRQTAGQDISAACGQLRLRREATRNLTQNNAEP